MSKELIEFTEEQKRIIKNQFFPPSATTEEMIYCMNIAKNMGLNPISKEIFFVPRRAKINGQWVEKIEPMLGRDSYVKVAHSTGLFAGIETTSKIERVPTIENGEWVEKDDLVATCKVWRKDTDIPFIVTVRYSEYVQKTNSGVPSKFWREKPDTMLKKVAESQALRKAFSINGAYSIEEVNDVEYDETHRASVNKIKNQPDPMQEPELDASADANITEVSMSEIGD